MDSNPDYGLYKVFFQSNQWFFPIYGGGRYDNASTFIAYWTVIFQIQDNIFPNRSL